MAANLPQPSRKSQSVSRLLPPRLLGNLTHSIGTLTVNANSTLDFSSTGNAQLTTTSLAMNGSNTLAVNNWTKNLDRFYATGANTPTPAKDAINLAPLNRIAMGANAASVTAWFSTGSEISVLAPPTLAMAFSPASVTSGLNSTLTITLTNPNATPLTGAAFTNAYPTNLVNAAIPGGTTTCMNSTVTAAASGTSLALSGATIPASGSCTITVNVTSATAGTYVNTLAAATLSSSGGSNAAVASATLTVAAPIYATYWDGANTTANNTVNGGTGTWNSTNTNWTTSTGTPNGMWDAGKVAVFDGSGGTVTVSGTQSISGLTIKGGAGYELTGGTLTGPSVQVLTDNTSAAWPVIGSTLAGGNYIFSTSLGSGKNIVLTGNNNYTGTTTLTVEVSAGAASLAGTSGIVVQSGGTLDITSAVNKPLTLDGRLHSRSSQTYQGNITLSADSSVGSDVGISVTGAIDTAGHVLTIESYPATGSNPPPTSIYGVISGAGSLKSINDGYESSMDNILGAANTYTGGTLINDGGLKTTVNNALPSTTNVTSTGTSNRLSLEGTSQMVRSVDLSEVDNELDLGAGGRLTLTNGASKLRLVLGSGTITVNSGATLTLTNGIDNPNLNIVLNGGTLYLGAYANFDVWADQIPHNIGSLTVNANSTLDFSSTGNAQLTTTSLTLSASNTLAVTNWTRGSDHFYTAAFVGAARNSNGVSPMNRITMGSNAASLTIWKADNEITLQLDPKVRISKTSNGGVGSFVFQLTGLSATNDSIATVANGIVVQGVGTLTGTSGVAATIAESGVPAGWPANPTSASCVDANGASNANGTAAFGTLTGNLLSITAAHMLQGADIACSFVNTLNAISGTVFNDGGAPTAGVNSGIPNDGLQNGSEAGLAGVSMGLTDCANVTHAVATTDSAGRYALSAPVGAVGQTVCVQPTLLVGQRSTGANVEGTVTPDGGTTTVGGTAFVYSRASSRQSFIEAASGTRTLNFGLVPESTLAANSSKSAAPGAIALHAHTFVAGTGGSVSFASGTSTATPAMAGWNEVMYLNPSCATSLPPGATKLSPPSVAQSVVQGQTVCFFVQAFVPAGAVNGSSNSAPVIATMIFTNAAPLLTATYTVTDVTTSGTSALSLQKEVRNITTGGAWGTNNQARSGDTLEYRISYTNPSAAPLSTVVITDGTSLYTTFVSANASTTSPALGSCSLNTPNNPAPAAGVACTPLHLGSGKGTVRWEFSGTLAPGASGSVTYSVLVD